MNSTPADFSAYVPRKIAKWAQGIKTAGVQAE